MPLSRLGNGTYPGRHERDETFFFQALDTRSENLGAVPDGVGAHVTLVPLILGVVLGRRMDGEVYRL